MRVAGHGDDTHIQPPDGGQDGEDFFTGAGVGQGNDHIAVDDHAEVAVAGFAGVQEERGCAGAGECRGDFVADVPGFAHAGNDDAPFAGEDGFAGVQEIIVQP